MKKKIMFSLFLATVVSCTMFTACEKEKPFTEEVPGLSQIYGDFYGRTYAAVNGSSVMTFNPVNGMHYYEAEAERVEINSSTAKLETLYSDYQPSAQWWLKYPNASGLKSIGKISKDDTITFHVNASTECTVLMVLALATPTGQSFSVENGVKISVNDTEMDTDGYYVEATDDLHFFDENPVGEAELKEGDNEIVIRSVYNDQLSLDYVVLVPTLTAAAIPEFTYEENLQIEVEACSLKGCMPESSSKASGGIKIGGLSYNSEVSFILNSDMAREVEISLAAAFGANSVQERIYLEVNGEYVQTGDLTIQTTDWLDADFEEDTLATVNLKEGKNLITLYSESGNFNMDYFVIK